MAKNKRPQEMTELVISNEQFKNASGMVEAGLAANAHKFVAEMKLVAEAVLETGEKLLVGRRKINEATGGFTQSFYVPTSKADLITRNINVRRDSYRARDDLSKHIVNLQNAEIVTGRRDVVMAERRYDYESANARRLGIRDIHAAGGLADKVKYRDLEHPYATAMYLPFDKAAYDARSGRTRAGWVQSQFNRAMSGESRNERSYAREKQAQAEAEKQRKEEIKEAREELQDKRRKDREQQREADRQARDAERLAKTKERAQALVQKAQERAARQEEQRKRSIEREEEQRREEEQKAEEKSNRERLALFAKIGVMLASVVALIRGISTSLLGAQSRAAGSSQSRLPEGFDLSTPILDGLRDAFGKLDFLGIFTPLVNAVTETVQKIRVQTLEGLQTGLTAAEVRLYDTNDVSHQLAAGTTVGAMKGLTSRARNIIALAQENNLGDDYAKMIMGSGLITELTDYSMGKGGYTTAGVFEDIIDAYFKQFKSGKNAIGHAVAPELLMQELTESIKSLMGEDAASVLNNMMLNSLEGSYYSPYSNFEEWMSSTRTMQLMQQGAFNIPKEQLDYANVLSKSMSDTEAMLQAVFDKFLLGMQDWLSDFLNAIDGVAYWFMSDYDKAVVDASNREKNTEAYKTLSAREAEARTKAAEALGYSESAMLDKLVTLEDSGGKITVGMRDSYSSAWNDEQVARLTEWLQLYEATKQAEHDMNTTKGRVPYRSADYTPEGLAYGRRKKVYNMLHEAVQKGPANTLQRFFGLSGEDRYVDADIATLFLSRMGFKGKDALDAIDKLFTGAINAEDFHNDEGTGYSQTPFNLTDLIDQIMVDFGGAWKLSKTKRDFSKEEIAAFYNQWLDQTKDNPAARISALVKALAKVTGESPAGLVYGKDYWKTYVEQLQQAQAIWLEQKTNSVMGFDLGQDVSSPVLTSPVLPAVDQTDAALGALETYVKDIVKKTLDSSRTSRGIYTREALEEYKRSTGIEQGVEGIRYHSTRNSVIRFELDVSKELADILKLKYRGSDIEGYLDFDTTNQSVTVRAAVE